MWSTYIFQSFVAHCPLATDERRRQGLCDLHAIPEASFPRCLCQACHSPYVLHNHCRARKQRSRKFACRNWFLQMRPHTVHRMLCPTVCPNVVVFSIRPELIVSCGAHRTLYSLHSLHPFISKYASTINNGKTPRKWQHTAGEEGSGRPSLVFGVTVDRCCGYLEMCA